MDAMGKMAIRNLHHFGWYESTILDAFDQKKMRIISMAMSVSYHFLFKLTHEDPCWQISFNWIEQDIIPEI